MEAGAGDSGGARSSRLWLWLLIGIWLAAAFVLVMQRADAIATMTLPDTDDNVRMLQLRDWLAGQGWFDLRQHRLDPPAGADLHWTRLVDLPLAATILLARPLVGGATAEMIAVVIVPLLTLLAALYLVARIMGSLGAGKLWAFGPAVLLTASPTVNMMAPLRIDHHGWQIVALLAMLLGLVSADRRRGGFLAGAALAVSLAIGVELLPYLAAGIMVAGLRWACDPEEAARLRPLLFAAAGGSFAALLLFVPPAARFALHCDALAGAYLQPLLLGAAGLALATLMRPATAGRRLLALAMAGAVAALPVIGSAGICLIDPYRAVDPAARMLWLENVSEAQPLARASAEVVVAGLALPLFGLAGALVMAWRGRLERGAISAWLALTAFSVISLLLMLFQMRATVAAQAIAVPGAAALIMLGWGRLRASGALVMRVLGPVLLFVTASGLLPRVAVAAIFAEPKTGTATATGNSKAACLAPHAIAALDRLPPSTLLSFIDTTPAILVHSHHRGIAGPYHRNGRAIADVMGAWSGDDAAARALLRRHGVDLVVLCGAPAEARSYGRRNPRGLYARLKAGMVPSWLRAVPLEGTPYRVWRVVG